MKWAFSLKLLMSLKFLVYHAKISIHTVDHRQQRLNEVTNILMIRDLLIQRTLRFRSASMLFFISNNGLDLWCRAAVRIILQA